jgi:hypothetical protein
VVEARRAARGFPSVIKEGLYDPDGSVYERTVYVHELIIGVARPLRRLDQPICGTAFYNRPALKRFQNNFDLLRLGLPLIA